MTTLTIANGCYAIEISTGDDGFSTIATLCPSARIAGHYVRLSPEQAVAIVRHLSDRVPGVAESIGATVSD